MNRVQQQVALLVVGVVGVGYAFWKLTIDGYYPSELPLALLALGVGGSALYVWQKMSNADQRGNEDEEI